VGVVYFGLQYDVSMHQNVLQVQQVLKYIKLFITQLKLFYELQPHAKFVHPAYLSCPITVILGKVLTNNK